MSPGAGFEDKFYLTLHSSRKSTLMHSIENIVNLSQEEAESAIRQALELQGFGVLTEIDVAATFKAKLNVDRPPLKILGACSPILAHRALELD